MTALTQSDLSLSTMWNYRKAQGGRELIEQLKALGFSAVELNYQVKAEWLGEIEPMVRAGEIRVSSVHNVFPKTYDARFDTDSALLGYADESLRRAAVELSKRSIDWAARLGAKAVVFHPTEVPLAPSEFDEPLKKLVAARQTHTEAYQSLRARMLAARQSAPYVSRMLASIEELCGYVVKNGLDVGLGMENRSMCHQVPIFSEFDAIVARFPDAPVGIWLDTGHGIMMQELGLQRLPLSEAARARILGMHIHDAADGMDHYAPYSLPGNVLDAYLPLIAHSPIRVLELSGRLSADEIRAGTARFLARYNELQYQ